jgi:hypothetical protein
MFANIEFNQAAFRHGVTEENIRCALSRPEYEGPLDDDANRYIVIGFDTAGNLLEVLYNEIDEHTVNVFHAMRCRNTFFHLLQLFRN